MFKLKVIVPALAVVLMGDVYGSNWMPNYFGNSTQQQSQSQPGNPIGEQPQQVVQPGGQQQQTGTTNLHGQTAAQKKSWGFKSGGKSNAQLQLEELKKIRELLERMAPPPQNPKISTQVTDQQAPGPQTPQIQQGGMGTQSGTVVNTSEPTQQQSPISGTANG